jgi:hypothetical protein
MFFASSFHNGDSGEKQFDGKEKTPDELISGAMIN